jgi:hypothetical protein
MNIVFWSLGTSKQKSNMVPGLGLSMRPTVTAVFPIGNSLKINQMRRFAHAMRLINLATLCYQKPTRFFPVSVNKLCQKVKIMKIKTVLKRVKYFFLLSCINTWDLKQPCASGMCLLCCK